MPDWFGPAAMFVVLIIAIPVGVLITGAVIAAILGTSLKADAETRNEGTEYVTIGQQG